MTPWFVLKIFCSVSTQIQIHLNSNVYLFSNVKLSLKCANSNSRVPDLSVWISVLFQVCFFSIFHSREVIKSSWLFFDNLSSAKKRGDILISHKGLFTYYVSQFWGFPLVILRHLLAYPPFPLRHPSSAFARPPFTNTILWQTLFNMIKWGIFICFGPIYILYGLALT